MKNAIGVASLTVATATIGWTFGSGHLAPESAMLLVLSWVGVTWSCMQD